LVHLGPIAREIQPSLIDHFSECSIFITPQGWLRAWDDEGQVHLAQWPESPVVLSKADVTVISIEDVYGDEDRITDMADSSDLLVVTEGAMGARVYLLGEMRRFSAPCVDEVDATGAGDIFATTFFILFHQTRDPWAAAKAANQMAALSVTRSGLESIPRAEEINSVRIKV
jgi:sugar/nucleoside kinase (ribokinase family)